MSNKQSSRRKPLFETIKSRSYKYKILKIRHLTSSRRLLTVHSSPLLITLFCSQARNFADSAKIDCPPPTSQSQIRLKLLDMAHPSGKQPNGNAVRLKMVTEPRPTKPPKLRVLIAPSGFKECLGPEEVADCIEQGFRRILDHDAATIRKAPLHDGGEGFCKALVAIYSGEIRELTVTGPNHQPVDSHFGIVGEDRKTGVLDMASAAGLSLVPKDCRDPTQTTTYGVGELIAAALDEGCTKIIIGCGDSGTSDGGAGMLQALGARLLDKHGNELKSAGGGATLSELETISMDNVHERLRNRGHEVQIEAVCNIQNVLCGPQGVARVYGPQKGATPEQVELLSSGLEKLAQAALPIINEDISRKPGSGASGGLGTGLLLLGAKLRARSDALDEYFDLRNLFDEPWDFVVTAEGSLDDQSPKGKMTLEIARRAHRRGAKVIALAGTLGAGAECVYDDGISAFLSILDGPSSLEKAIEDSRRLLKDAAEKCIRMIQLGMSMQKPGPSRVLIQNVSQESTYPSLLKLARAMTG